MGQTYGTQSYRSGGQADQAAVAGMRLMHRVGILMTELVDDAADLVVVSMCYTLSDGFLETGRDVHVSHRDGHSRGWRGKSLLEGTELPAVVKLVV